ncbi:MAG: AMP-binding protein [Alcaligenaceae bacterium]|nr:AMP-binding protein [Alcaligenaceae bacterium]
MKLINDYKKGVKVQQERSLYWPKGIPEKIHVPQVTLPHCLATSAQRYPDKAAIVFCENTFTFASMKARVDSMAAYLQKALGVAKGERVLLFSQNCPQFIIAYYAVLSIGGVIVPVNAMCTTEEVRYFMENSGAKYAFVARELVEAVLPCMQTETADGLRHIVVHAYKDILENQESDTIPEFIRKEYATIERVDIHDFQTILTENRYRLDEVEVSPDDFCILPYTSGTTGKSKGCIHTHRTMLSAIYGSAMWRHMHAESVILAVAPMFHLLGMQNCMNIPIFLGATVIMMPRWDAGLAVQLSARYRISSWTAAPAMVLDFFSHPLSRDADLSSLSLLSGGGAAMAESVALMLKERFGIVYNEGYGMTETASFLHCNPLNHPKRQCLGIETQGVESRIVDPVTLEELPHGEVGELVTSGSQVMLGYWDNPQANEESFFERDGKRFFRTGDLARIDEDGYFFMADRLKRMINVSGYKVWPSEVENMMYAHPAIQEVCVVGIHDEKQGEQVRALVVLKEGEDIKEKDIIAWSREHMAVYKAPRSVTFFDELPKSNTGKIMWRQLQNEQNERLSS